jgi:aromatic-L-amino-acid/L-tryptophan decarboxylase
MNEEPHSDSGANLDPLNWHSLVPRGIGCSTIFSTTSSKSASARYGNQSQIACAPVLVHRYPRRRTDLAVVHQEFMRDILSYSAGNSHPGFMGWVHGGGNPAGMLAEMLAAGLNASLGGRDHAPIEVERQIVRWVRELFGFPVNGPGARGRHRKATAHAPVTLSQKKPRR